jgi:hypothetical protein
VVSKPALLILILSAVSAPAATPPITNPVNFVTDVYARFVKAQSGHNSYNPPEDIFTPRLRKLVQDDRKRAKGEVGCLDFDFWVNGQDWAITKLSVTTGGSWDKSQWTVIAKFLNTGDPQEIHFDFRRLEQHWLLAEVRSVKEPRWTLSEILRCTP